ncbi:MAG: (Fe-S)-binding protein [Promethearchaeota archaeon]
MSLERLEALRQDMKKCVRCSLCKLIPLPTIQQTRFISACPPVDEYHFHAYSGGGINIMALSLLDGRVKVDEDLARIVSACTTCGMCDVACKFIMAAERQEVILALKEHIVRAGLGITPTEERTQKSVFWADGLNLKTLSEEKSNVLLFVGAGANYNPQHAISARKLAQILQYARVNFGILEGEEPTSGIEAYWTGQHQEFSKTAHQVTERLNKARTKIIVTLSGEDLGMLRSKYSKFGYTIKAKVLHASEYLWFLIRKHKLRLTHPIQQHASYHDPCYLGRQSEPIQPWKGEERQTHGVMRYFKPPKPINYGVKGVFDAPRKVLRAIPGLDFIEMHRIREYSYCCGGGGGVPIAHPNVAKSAAQQRIEEARDVGAELLVTACQHCLQNLSHSQEDPVLPVVDLVDIVYEATGLESNDE